jgi:hypothetical protein
MESAYACFRVIELHATSKSSLGEKAKLGDNQLVELCSSISARVQHLLGSQDTLL